MTRKQIAILAGLGLAVLFAFCVLGYLVLAYFGISTPEPIAIPKLAPESVGGKPGERARIAKHVALYDGGGGTLDELCSLQAALFVGIGGGQILPPQQGDADFYRSSETNHYWIAMSNDPSGNVWTVTCVVNFSRVTAEGVIPMSEPMLPFLYNTADGYIYPQGNELVSLLATMGYVKYGSGQPRIYAPLD